MSDILRRICDDKRRYLEAQRAKVPLSRIEREAENAPAVRSLAQRLIERRSTHRYSVIAEIKRGSPSRGIIRSAFDPIALARAYQDGGAAALSILTDEPYFFGSDLDLANTRPWVALPILRKDFILEPYQVVESRALGADCLLVILAAVDDRTAASLIDAARTYRMDVLLEVHTRDEVRRALEFPETLIGINNRDLKTLKVDLSVSETLAPLIPSDRVVISESGLGRTVDLERMKAVGVDCFLIGERLLEYPDVAQALRTLLNPTHV